MNQEQIAFVAELANLKPSSTFLTLKGYRNSYSEIADYNIVFHMSYEAALKKSLEIIQKYNPTGDYEKIAREELITSFQKSLSKLEDVKEEEMENHYLHFVGEDGKFIKGVKMHLDTETLHLYGLVVHKKVTCPGEYPEVDKRRKLTAVKDKLRGLCPVSKFRQFKVTSENVDSVQVANLSLLPPEL
jgi:hypothetical protein